MWYQCNTVVKISIHALLAESDVTGFDSGTMVPAFLSTLSLRRATGMLYYFCPVDYISIHALLAESDAYGRINDISRLIFLSTLSLRRATGQGTRHSGTLRHFYPRSPCGERLRSCPASSPRRYFYPRSPCGERPSRLHKKYMRLGFLSTLSLRRATLRVLDGSKSSIISIHALLAESDTYPSQCRTLASDFYPRSPCGERHSDPVTDKAWALISIHALLAESDGVRHAN